MLAPFGLRVRVFRAPPQPTLNKAFPEVANIPSVLCGGPTLGGPQPWRRLSTSSPVLGDFIEFESALLNRGGPGSNSMDFGVEVACGHGFGAELFVWKWIRRTRFAAGLLCAMWAS